MRAVLDTNVLVSGLLFGGPPQELVRLAEAGAFEIVASEETLAELEEVVSRSKFTDRLRELGRTPGDVARGFRSIATIVVPEPIDGICSDHDDDIFIGAALSAQADVIVSGDTHLLGCSTKSPVPVLRVSEFLAVLRGSS